MRIPPSHRHIVAEVVRALNRRNRPPRRPPRRGEPEREPVEPDRPRGPLSGGAAAELEFDE